MAGVWVLLEEVSGFYRTPNLQNFMHRIFQHLRQL